MPATIGSFSVCFGKITNHPNTEALPFSYIIAYNDKPCIVPGRNIATVGLIAIYESGPNATCDRRVHRRVSLISSGYRPSLQAK